MSFNTTEFIITLANEVSQTLPCYYEHGPVQNAAFPYAVLSGVHVSALENAESGDYVSFYLDVWADENSENATVELEKLCDALRGGLQDKIISSDGIFSGHICFENRGEIPDGEFDIAHRRLTLTARIFFIQEGK